MSLAGPSRSLVTTRSVFPPSVIILISRTASPIGFTRLLDRRSGRKPIRSETMPAHGASTRIIDRATGEIFTGRVPAYSVVVAGTLPGRALPDGSPGPGLACAVIVKRVDAQTRRKTAINDLLRE